MGVLVQCTIAPPESTGRNYFHHGKDAGVEGASAHHMKHVAHSRKETRGKNRLVHSLDTSSSSSIIY